MMEWNSRVLKVTAEPFSTIVEVQMLIEMLCSQCIEGS